MITQNPITGKARKKLGALYARTLYGKNVIQQCPPSRKGKQTKAEQEASRGFGFVSLLSAQLSASILNQIYYAPPTGRNRRQQWCKDLMTGRYKEDDQWNYNPALIRKLGGNPKVSESAISLTPASTEVVIPMSNFSAVNNAITTEPPCIILICVEACICISLLDYTTIVGENIVLQNLSTTLVGKECWLFPLWQTNVGTQQNPIICYGRYEI